MKHSLISWILAAAALCAGAGAAAPEPAPWDAEAFQQYEFGQSRAPLIRVEDAVRQALNQPAQQALVEQRLLDILQSGASIECKRFVCRQLLLIASDRSVPVLAGFLDHPALADPARYALQRIASPAAGAALRQALSTTHGHPKVGVIYALSERRDRQAAPALIGCLSDPDDAVARAAIAALEKVGGQNAIQALQQAFESATPPRRIWLAHALIARADRLLARGQKDAAAQIFLPLFNTSETQAIRMAALRGLVTADSGKYFHLLLAILSNETDPLLAIAADHLRHLPGAELTQRAAAELPRLPAAARVRVVAALGDRQDPAALPAIAAAVRSDDDTLSVAALSALASLGGAGQVPLLADYIAADHPDRRAAAQSSLNMLRGKDVDGHILQCIEQRDTQTQNELIRSLGARVSTAAVPTLLEIARRGDPALRSNTYKALGATAGLDDLPALLERVAGAQQEAERTAAEDAIAAACVRQADQEKCVDIVLQPYPAATASVRCALLRILGTIRHERGLPTVRQSLSDPNPEIQNAALRVLAEWPSPTAADDLLRCARAAANPTQRILALRGFIAIAGLPGLPNADQLALFQQASAESQRPEEIKLVLGGLAAMTAPEAFQLAQKHLANSAVAAEAAAAMIKVAGALKGRSADVVAPGLQAILDSSASSSLKAEARKVLQTLPATAR
ncbi:MAG TPA: HEAT repeat domain-containing protein [Candidatus Paceibacterota bacterium]|nr:HEAT repeat domain-containing protein [Verrucomicrobiota bacterium]HOX02218.1 HEAT repeat domain-containing protein [Verrucomicrobiota bacterium]HRZ45041.1 HEAT repeat domain-containing protein [Candidatus Paceibacterota bacterium]HRZ92668.1 HEAT repeat domain-containing protein [Candidatus Paceibacterota bacterium]